MGEYLGNSLLILGPGGGAPAPFVSDGTNILVLDEGASIGPANTYGDQFGGGSEAPPSWVQAASGATGSARST